MRLKTKFDKEFEGKSYNTDDIWEWLDKNIQLDLLVNETLAGKLTEILNVLDNYLGDTDPHMDEDITDEEIKEDYPIFWVCKEIAELSKCSL